MKSIAKPAATLMLVFIGFQLSFAQQLTMFAGISNPESVVADDNFIYVTDIGKELKPMEKDGDGKIWRLTKDGKFIDNDFFKAKLNSPKGTALFNNLLYIADIDRVVVLNTKTGNLINEISLEKFGVKLLNDLCIKDGKELFATCTISGKVFNIPLNNESKISVLDIPEIKGANGISYDATSNKLVVVGLGSFDSPKGLGEIYIVSLNGKQPTSNKLNGITGFFDGVEWLDENHIITDDWVSLSENKGIVNIVNIKTLEIKKLNPIPIGGPADFFLDKEQKQLIVPATLQGRLIRLSTDKRKLNPNVYEAGFSIFENIKKENADQHIKNITQSSPEIASNIIEYAYGNIYNGLRLDMKTAELCVVAILAAKGGLEPQLKIHISEGFNFGATKKDLEDVMKLVELYSGIPNAINGLKLISKED
jgi:alkylhydroperoxidase/carboxymuconolactone decarboxylase family protein YurZ